MPLLKFEQDQLVSQLEASRQEVTFAEWREAGGVVEGAGAIVVPNDARFEDLQDAANGFEEIVLEFPAFKDGRAYSQARLLRDRIGFTGEIRARGEVLRDQLFFMVRCGFTAFEFDGASADAAQNAIKEFSLVYQAASDRAEPVWRRRISRAAAA